MLEPTGLTTSNFYMLFDSPRKTDDAAKTILWNIVEELTAKLPNFHFDQQRVGNARALWALYDFKTESYTPTSDFKGKLDYFRETLGPTHSLILKAERGLQLREEMGEQEWRQFLDQYYKDEALIYVLWAQRMQESGLKHDDIYQQIIARLRGEDSPIKDRLDLFDTITKTQEGAGKKNLEAK